MPYTDSVLAARSGHRRANAWPGRWMLGWKGSHAETDGILGRHAPWWWWDDNRQCTARLVQWI